MIYRQVIPYRSIFEEEGQLVSTAANPSLRPDFREKIFKRPLRTARQESIEKITPSQEWSSDEAFDAMQYAEVLELWHHPPDVLPKTSTTKTAGKYTDCQTGLVPMVVTENNNDEHSVSINSNNIAILPSTNPKAVGKEVHQGSVRYAGWWVCCQYYCGREINYSIWGITCCDCSHECCFLCGDSSSI
jgi:hypothetical protein